MVTPGPEHDGIDAVLATARSRDIRVSAAEAYAELESGAAILVDTRPEAQRREHGEVAVELRPLHVERNVLERRFDRARTPGCRRRRMTRA